MSENVRMFIKANCEKCGEESIVDNMEFLYGKLRCPRCKKRMNTMLDKVLLSTSGEVKKR